MMDSDSKVMESLRRDFSRTGVLISTLILSFLFVATIMFSGGDVRVIAVFPGLALLLVGILNFEVACFLLVSSIFADIYFFNLSLAVWFALPLGASFLFTHKKIGKTEFSNPLTLPLMVYGLCILPSFANAANPTISLFMLLNVVSFLIILFSFVAGLHSYKVVQRIAAFYLFWVLVVSFDVIGMALSGVNRPFGFAGIWFVDYSALGVCLAATIAIVSTGKIRVFSFALAMLIAVASVLTQTRSTWSSAIITLVGLVGYLVWRPQILGYTRRQVLVSVAIGTVMMVGVVTATMSLNPKIETRAVQLAKQSGYGFDRQGNVENSLASRILIWDTALNAFKAHPFIGIGVYQFRFSSRYYSTLPRFLYEIFVSKLSTHQTHLAVLSETGIVGFIGFLVFIIATVKTTIKSVTLAANPEAKRHGLVAAVCVAYCLISMFITDAWLWGPQIVLLGLVIGSMLAISKIGGPQPIERA